MIKVAIIEDDPMMRDLLVASVEACADMMVTGTAQNVAEAGGMIEAGGYDVLLCDLGLPDGDGARLVGASGA